MTIDVTTMSVEELSFRVRQDAERRDATFLLTLTNHPELNRIINSSDKFNGLTPILYALFCSCEDRNNDYLRVLLEMGADPNQKSGPGMSYLPLAEFSGSGNLEAVKMLVNAGAHVDGSNDRWYYMPLLCAARTGHTAVVEFLLDAGANLNIREQRCGATPLLVCTYHLDIVRLLLSRGADPNGVLWNGVLMLDDVLRCRQYDVAKLLLEYGANPHYVYKIQGQDRTVFDITQERDDNQALEILEPYRHGQCQQNINV